MRAALHPVTIAALALVRRDGGNQDRAMRATAVEAVALAIERGDALETGGFLGEGHG